MLTYRQREFARHYATGLAAPVAAQAAGYAASTAETNAARLLKHPLICQAISQHRNQGVYVSSADMREAVERLRTLIASRDDARALAAIRMLAQIQRRQPAPDRVDAGFVATEAERAQQRHTATFHPDQISDVEKAQLQSDLAEQDEQERRLIERLQTGLDNPTTNDAMYDIDYEQLVNTARQNKLVEEADTLPNGQPAFDTPPPHRLTSARLLSERLSSTPIQPQLIPEHIPEPPHLFAGKHLFAGLPANPL